MCGFAGRVLSLLCLSLCINLRSGFVVFLVLFGFSLKTRFVVFSCYLVLVSNIGLWYFLCYLVSIVLDYDCDLCFSLV